MTTDERLAVLEHKVDALSADVRELCDVVLGLRLHEARMEWAEKAIWILFGAAVTVGGGLLIAAMKVGAVPAAR